MKNHLICIILSFISVFGCTVPPSQPYPQTAANSQTQSTVTQPTTQTQPQLTIPEIMVQAVDQAFRNINRSSRIALVNFATASPEISDALLRILEHTLVEKDFIVVDRSELDRIRAEQNLQLSGDVDDNTAVSIGRFVGADVIVTGAVDALRQIGIRVLNTQTAIVVGTSLLPLPASITIEPARQGVQRTTQMTTRTTPTNETNPIQLIPGAIIPQGNTLAEQLSWISNQGGNGTTYDIVINSDVSLLSTTVSTRGRNISINIRSENSSHPRTIQLMGQGSLFILDANITLILQDIIIRGHSNNNRALVFIGPSKLILDTGSKIVGNTNISGYGGGVRLDSGIIELNDGSEISGNIVSGTYAYGGGIYASNRSTVTINGGKITGNSASDRGTYPNGGGLFLASNSTGMMSGGEISRNRVTHNGGGVHTSQGTTFIKRARPGNDTSGIIYGNVGENANIAGRRGQAIFHDMHPATSLMRNITLGYYDEINTAVNVGWQ